MTAISKEKLMLLKSSLQHYPYIWIGMSRVQPSPVALTAFDRSLADNSVAGRKSKSSLGLRTKGQY